MDGIKDDKRTFLTGAGIKKSSANKAFQILAVAFCKNVHTDEDGYAECVHVCVCTCRQARFRNEI